MEMLANISHIIAFMVHNNFHHDPVYKDSLDALNSQVITSWEFVCHCQYITDRETIQKLSSY